MEKGGQREDGRKVGVNNFERCPQLPPPTTTTTTTTNHHHHHHQPPPPPPPPLPGEFHGKGHRRLGFQTQRLCVDREIGGAFHGDVVRDGGFGGVSQFNGFHDGLPEDPAEFNGRPWQILGQVLVQVQHDQQHVPGVGVATDPTGGQGKFQPKVTHGRHDPFRVL